MSEKPLKIAVIGAGAAGCFFEVEAKRRCPEAQVIVFESGKRAMAKLSLTGGGQCNITNSFENVRNLSEVYPRGFRLMKRLLHEFSQKDTLRWFEKEGVSFITLSDGRIFPKSRDAMQIVGVLDRLMRKEGVELRLNKKLLSLKRYESSDKPFLLEFEDASLEQADRVLIATGGKSSRFLKSLLPESVKIVDTVPSLYTFKIADETLRAMTGTAVKNAVLKLSGTNFHSSGPLLITDWGLSGPAVLKLSSYAAVFLADIGKKAEISVNWTGLTEPQVREVLHAFKDENSHRQVKNIHPFALTNRLWKHILSRAGISENKNWYQVGNKDFNRLVNTLVSDSYFILGRGPFKEEFVTSGGVALDGVNPKTLESRTVPGLYFAGEVLDIDGITGGFNLQAAWSTAWCAAKAIHSDYYK